MPVAVLKKTSEKIYTQEKLLKTRGVNVILCSDYKIRRLNRTYRTIDKPTDVLSFPFAEDDFLGEIYISLQRSAVQARRFALKYEDEVNRLFVHGMFHILGFDHETLTDRKSMERRERRYH
jgi:probable rRNA maturation factor